MWFVVNTGKGKENAAKSFLLNKVKGAKEVYITPYRKIRHIDEDGQSVETVAPLLMNYVFVNIKVEKRISSKFLGLRTDVGEKKMVFRQLSRSLEKGGYFSYHVRANDYNTGESVLKKIITNYHLLCASPSDTPIESIMEQSWVPDNAMNAFMVYNNQVFSSADQLRIEPVSYSKLIKEHDIVRVLRGQFAGQEGVVKRSHKGKSDRRFYIEFSNNLCFSISGIHQNDIAIVHEATDGKSAKEVSLWRDIDTVIGALQFDGHPDDAPKYLRQLLKSYGQKLLDILPHLSDEDRIKAEIDVERITENNKREVLSHIPPQARNVFKVIGDFFNTFASTDYKVLREYIPNLPIRPFLTPTPGTEFENKEFTTLHHNGFEEYIVKTNLSKFFSAGVYDKNKYVPVFDEDYQYYAHVAIVEDCGLRKAIAPWGGFYDRFSNMSIPQLKDLAQKLLKRKYTKTYYLLNMAQYVEEVQSDDEVMIKIDSSNESETYCVFEKVDGIGGFSMIVGDDGDYQTVQKLIATIVPAAVEIWQGTRLQDWRQLLQRYVLLHKVPVIDQPIVIGDDVKMEDLFNTKDSEGNPDLNAITKGVNDYSEIALDALKSGDIYKAVSNFLKLAKYAGATFVDNEIYNYLGEQGYEPDSVCTKLYNEITASVQDRQKKDYLHRGYAELCETDAWKYFHLPTFLKKALRSNNN